MRVISGEKKGIHLKAVSGINTRPTTDKVKESIFNVIGPYFSGGWGLDLFAGSGGLGIEALSRGMERVIFIDRDKNAIQTIKSNIERCGYQDQSEVFRNDAERALKAVSKRNIKFSCIFLDPPYRLQKLALLLELIDEFGILEKNGVIMCEHDSEVSLPESIGSLTCIKGETYGVSAVSIYRLQSEDREE
ncbi:16S rRNA (guanine(966)-N(2))-methyltransferase RsmD [Jeotgalibacillus soli]|uniref:rRNA methyltransferase n=1 Tax=Jeotgalibacillus soli TaxID=889306 RepID=A0A0C2VJW4_9BACL|nr:16S rRNA (guanine(966)-N(2))-methyltransferase RsmD [Jeotgalibacillus soli]KIL44771.1 rRNA methyltransferase [Jeotgalibacillus soli]